VSDKKYGIHEDGEFFVKGDCYEAAKSLWAEVSSLESRLAELQSKTYCAYCGAEFAITDAEAAKEAITKHIYECVEHPVYIATKRAESAESRLQAVTEALQNLVNACENGWIAPDAQNARPDGELMSYETGFNDACKFYAESSMVVAARKALAPPTEPTEAAGPLPTIDEMCGLIPDLTEGRTLKEYMKDLDDDE
jgi:hypothetical protein